MKVLFAETFAFHLLPRFSHCVTILLLVERFGLIVQFSFRIVVSVVLELFVPGIHAYQNLIGPSLNVSF